MCEQTDSNDHAVLHLAGERDTNVCGNLGDGGRSVDQNWSVSSEGSILPCLSYVFSAARCERQGKYPQRVVESASLTFLNSMSDMSATIPATLQV